jgi:hypothetical protein
LINTKSDNTLQVELDIFNEIRQIKKEIEIFNENRIKGETPDSKSSSKKIHSGIHKQSIYEIK